jgi:hypothetical protein
MSVAGDVLKPVLIDGGKGNDKLIGGGLRSILVGGEGSDSLVGGSGDDLLIGGTVSWGLNPALWGSVLDEWASGHSYADRVKNLRGDSSSTTYGQRLNGTTFLQAGVTVLDDHATDYLNGSSGLDWNFAHLTGSNQDQINGNTNGEFVDSLP